MEGRRKCAWLKMSLSVAGEPMEGVTDIYIRGKRGSKDRKLQREDRGRYVLKGAGDMKRKICVRDGKEDLHGRFSNGEEE